MHCRKNCVSHRSSVQRIKIVDSSELTAAKFLIYLSFKFTYFFIVDMWTLKMNFVKENKKPFTAIKTTAKHKNFSERYIIKLLSYLHKGFKEVAHAVRNSELFRVWSKKF